MRTMCIHFGVATSLFAVSAFAADPVLLPTNLPGVFKFHPPPAGFEPLRASDEDLHAYGFPPRPHAFHSPRAYAGWQHLVAAARTRIEPVLRRLKVRHMPRIRPPLLPGAAVFHDQGATNWSGEVLTSGATGYGANSFYALWAEYNVPIAEQQYGVCNGGTEYSSTWIGLDGNSGGSADVVQAGTEADATCVGGFTTPTYYAWYEWYPADGAEITNFPISPGDDIGVEVAVGSATSAAVYMTNETTDQYAAIGFYAPAGTRFIGNSAEWIVERPEVGTNLSTLANFVTEFMYNIVSLADPTNTRVVWGGQGAPGIPWNDITMYQGASPIAVPTTVGIGGLEIQATGPAR